MQFIPRQDMYEIVDKCVRLRNGELMPLLGLGCWQSPEAEVKNAVIAALDAGYRHIDTAYLYLNEDGVGAGIKEWLSKTGKKRSEVFVVTKLPMIGMHPDAVKKYLSLSLKKLGLDYVDLYLIHCPIGYKEPADVNNIFPVTTEGKPNLDFGTDLIAIWKEMERMANLGLAKSIGVSNFTERQIQRLLGQCTIKPAVNQIELHVNFQQKEMVEFCMKENIIVTAYAPLGSPGRKDTPMADKPLPNLLSNPVVKLVSENHKVTTAQVLIRFWIEQGVVVIPKSVNPDRIKTNGDVFGFKLSDLEMDCLRLLDLGLKGRTFEFLAKYGFEKHPESHWVLEE